MLETVQIPPRRTTLWGIRREYLLEAAGRN
jgi:hypothetical protein